MGGPTAGHIVLYTFVPPTDSWTGQYIEIGEAPPFYGGSITDTYDIVTWATDSDPPPLHPYTSDCWLYKTASVAGWIHRFKCTFSLSPLPQSGYPMEYRDIAGIFLVAGGGGFSNPVVILINSAGKFLFEEGGTQSSNAIAAGTEYDLELYLDLRPGRAKPSWQLYINDVLWLEDNSQSHTWWSPPDTPGIWCGSNQSPGANQNTTVTLHMESIIWTIERIGGPYWTMMAPGIA